jgi:peptidoglycan/xylan/chitin deacetylase (PgdA/CDA1 family)
MLGELATAAAAGLTAGGLYYGAMAPWSQMYGRTLIAGCDQHEIALTYDDGPNDIHTGHLLEVLAKHNVRATFFMIGERVRQRPQMAREVLAAGHCIGNHTMTHPNLLWCSASRIWSELAECNAVLADTLGMVPDLFRPPYGARRPHVLRVANALGMTPVLWNVSSCDWKITDPTALMSHVQQGLRKTMKQHRSSNILMHDGGHTALGIDRSQTVAATAMLLDKCVDIGVQFVTPERWL